MFAGFKEIYEDKKSGMDDNYIPQYHVLSYVDIRLSFFIYLLALNESNFRGYGFTGIYLSENVIFSSQSHGWLILQSTSHTVG